MADAPTDAPSSAPDVPDGLLPAGAKLGSYRIVGLLGRGGMGEVYEAWDARLARAVALKRIPVSRQADAASRARLWREARMLAALRHPGIVTIFDIGEDPESGSLFLAMELVRGRALADVAQQALPLRLAVYVGHEVAAALGAAHAAGVAHRDVKPANILVEDDGAVRVLDFGLARRVDELDDRLTHSGAVLGTPGYMAPEVVAGAPSASIGPPADVFALGTLMYRLVSGVHPFQRDSVQATAVALAGAVHTPLGERVPRLSPALVELIERCLALDPNDRPPHGTAVAEALARIELPPAPIADRAALAALVRHGAPVADPPLETRNVAPPPARSRSLALPLAFAAIVAVTVTVVATSSPTPVAITPPTLAPTAIAPAPAPTLTPAPASSAPAPAPFVLPPRPAVVVLGFTVERPADQNHADVLADVLRVRLDEDPEHLLCAGLELTRALIPSGPTIGPDLAPERFVRPNRTLGHIDVVIRGKYRSGDGVSVEAELVDTLTARVFDTVTATGPDVMSAADTLARALLVRLGGVAPAIEARLTPLPEAWSAWMTARAANTEADLGVMEENLNWALRVDPKFGLARVEELGMLVQQSRRDVVVAKGRALLDAEIASPTLPLHYRERLEALVAFCEDRIDDSVRQLYKLLERYPFDLDSNDLLMAVRAVSRVRDLDESQRLARKQLMLAPRLEVAASRLIRALATQGEAAEADRFIRSLGVPEDDRSWLDVYAELDLFTGRFAEAGAGFRKVVAQESGNVYAEHMAIAADVLDGRCDKAAGTALDRIDKYRLLDRDSLLGWTYSLATQALTCWEQWTSLEDNLVAWAAYGDDPAFQPFGMRERVLLTRARLMPASERATEEARLEKRWREQLATNAVPAPQAPVVRDLYAQVTHDRAVLDELVRVTEAAAVDTRATSVERADARYLAARIRARIVAIEGRPVADVVRAYDEGVMPWSEVQSEAQLAVVIDAIAARAEARAQLGDAVGARADWETIRGEGYHRLWANEAWVLARHRLEGR